MEALEGVVEEYITESFTPYKSNMILEILDNIYTINNLPNIDVNYNFPYVNSFLTDLIAEDSLEVDKEENVILVEHNIKKTLRAYLEAYGILLDEDEEICLGFYKEITEALLEIFSMEKTGLEIALRTLDDTDTENNLVMSNLLSEYCNLSGSEIYSKLDQISNDMLENLRDTIEKRLEAEDESDLDSKIRVLIDTDEVYGCCKFVDQYLQGKEVEPNINIVYNIINMSYKDVNEIIMFGAYDIAAYLYMNVHVDDYQDTVDNLSYDHIQLIGDSQELQDKFKSNLNMLVDELKRMRHD